VRVFRLPDVGEGLREAEIVEWLVAAGDEVDAGQPVVLVETDKAQVEVTSPRGGRIARCIGAPGDVVAVGAPLLEFEDGEEEDAGTVVGELPRAAPLLRGEPGVRAAPAVRARARELGIDLTRLTGSGPQGAISLGDLEAAGAGELAQGAERLRGVRMAMARNMARAGAQVVPATVTDDADVEAWIRSEADVAVRLVRAVAAGARAEPALNAHFDGVRAARALHEAVHLAFAVQTDDGLFAPVLRNAGARDAADLRAEIDRLAEGAGARSLAPEALRGATFTLSNFGVFGGRYASLVVVPPQVGILGAGRVKPRACAGEHGPEVRRLLPLSLTFDHRAVTGAEATRFLTAVIEDLERAS
jgi:pyruvate dehydrogenase E2 component (dihydrolipoamide acetyltransferase)